MTTCSDLKGRYNKFQELQLQVLVDPRCTFAAAKTGGSFAVSIWLLFSLLVFFFIYSYYQASEIKQLYHTGSLAARVNKDRAFCRTPGRRCQVCVTEDSSKRNITIGTCNTRTLRVAGKLQKLAHEIYSYRWNILGLCEMKWKNFGVTTTEERHKVFFSGMEDKHEHGVGILLHKNILNTSSDVAQSPTGSSPSA